MKSAYALTLCVAALGLPLACLSESGTQVAAGAQLFQSTGCTHCHGETLGGTETAPALRDVGRRLKPEAIADQIRHGGQAMPAFGDVLTEDQVAQLVTYLKKQKSKVPKTKAARAGGASGMP